MKSRPRGFRAHATEYALFLAIALFTWTEFSSSVFLLFGKSVGFSKYPLVVLWFTICWMSGCLPFAYLRTWFAPVKEATNEKLESQGASSADHPESFSAASLEFPEPASDSSTASVNQIATAVEYV